MSTRRVKVFPEGMGFIKMDLGNFLFRHWDKFYSQYAYAMRASDLPPTEENRLQDYVRKNISSEEEKLWAIHWRHCYFLAKVMKVQESPDSDEESIFLSLSHTAPYLRDKEYSTLLEIMGGKRHRMLARVLPKMSPIFMGRGWRYLWDTSVRYEKTRQVKSVFCSSKLSVTEVEAVKQIFRPIRSH